MKFIWWKLKMSYHSPYPSWDPATNCKRLREFEEIEFSRQRCRRDLNSKVENSFKTFDWISSKNSASGRSVLYDPSPG